MRRLAVVLLLALWLVAGCSSGGRTCARHGDAELCLVHQSGAYRIDAAGLQPGTEVAATVDGRRSPQGHPVGTDGRWPPGGSAVALLGAKGPITVEAVAADGERLRLTVGD
jgi:hypothetical protein